MKGGGSLALTFLGVIALVLVILAWSSYFSSQSALGDLSSNVFITVSQAEFNRQYIIAEAKLIANQTISSSSNGDMKSKFIQIAATHQLNISQEGNFFAKIKNGDFTFTNQGNISSLQIPGVNLEAEDPTLQIKRVFDLNLTFDQNGNVLT